MIEEILTKEFTIKPSRVCTKEEIIKYTSEKPKFACFWIIAYRFGEIK